jgi:hypothetical protein
LGGGAEVPRSNGSPLPLRSPAPLLGPMTGSSPAASLVGAIFTLMRTAE